MPRLAALSRFLFVLLECRQAPDSKVYGANMGPIWGRQDPGGPHVGPMNNAIWGSSLVHIPAWLLVRKGLQSPSQQDN